MPTPFELYGEQRFCLQGTRPNLKRSLKNRRVKRKLEVVVPFVLQKWSLRFLL